MEYIASHVEKLEEGSTDNSRRRINMAETNFMDAYIPYYYYYIVTRH